MDWSQNSCFVVSRTRCRVQAFLISKDTPVLGPCMMLHALQPPRCSPGTRLGSTAQGSQIRLLPALRPSGRREQKPLAAIASAALGDLADAAAVGLGLGPLLGAGVALAGVAGLRFWAYSQLEYVTAAMLARHVKAGGARVLQLGGSTRDLFYYPQGTVQVTVVGGPDIKEGLWEQAGMQARVPTSVRRQPSPDNLLFQPDASVDSVVLLGTLGAVSDMSGFCSEVFRVLKPGGTFVFVQRVRGGALQPLLLGALPAVDATTIDMVTEFSRWDYVQCDPALQSSDLHAAGVAIKPLSKAVQGDDRFSVDKSAFEQMMKSAARSKGSSGGGSGSQGFGKK